MTMILPVVLLTLLAGPFEGPCQLLTSADVRAVQGTPVRDARSTLDRAKGLEYAQCVFATEEFVRSISLTVISGPADATQKYWTDTFHPKRSEAETKAALRKKELPRAVPGIADEAFWTGDSRTGALYARKGDTVLRLSIGGVADEEERLRRTRQLAELALKRLQ